MSDYFDAKMVEDYEQFELIQKITNTKGYIYLIRDTAYPLHIKVGKTTNLYKRLRYYNEHKPYPSAKYSYISRVFGNKDEAEKKILAYLYNHIEPTTFRNEWFEVKHEALLLEVVTAAEAELS